MKVEKRALPPMPPPPSEYVITLSEKEATDLLHIVGCIGGLDPARETVNALWDKLGSTAVLNRRDTPFQGMVLVRKKCE